MIGADELRAIEEAALAEAGDDVEAWLLDRGIDVDAFIACADRFAAAMHRTGAPTRAAISVGFQLGWIARSMGGQPSG